MNGARLDCLDTKTRTFLSGEYQECGLKALDLLHRSVHGHLTDMVEQDTRHILYLGLGIARERQKLEQNSMKVGGGAITMVTKKRRHQRKYKRAGMLHFCPCNIYYMGYWLFGLNRQCEVHQAIKYFGVIYKIICSYQHVSLAYIF